MRININSPEGNTMVALGLARILMREAECHTSEIDLMTRAVMEAGSPEYARVQIEKATHGVILFVDD